MATAIAELRRGEPDLLSTCRAALAAAASVRDRARDRLAARLAPGGRLDGELLEREQHAAHGLAWLEVHVRSLEALLDWAERLRAAGRLGERERLQLGWGFAEYLARLSSGWPMAQGEMVRPHELGLGEADLRPLRSAEVEALVREGGTTEAYQIDPSGELRPIDIEEAAAGGALVIRSGGGRAGELFELAGERTTIGRSPNSDVFLDDVTVSRNHAVVVRRRDGFYIDDLGSLNGTYVNRRRIESHRLSHGDELQIGKYRLTFLER